MTKGALTEQAKPATRRWRRMRSWRSASIFAARPAIYLASGQQLGGYVPAAQIEQALAKK